MKNKQELFIEYYIALRFNGTRAAEAAGYTGDDRSLAATASRLLRTVKVKEAIADYLKEQGATKEEVVQRLTEHSRADMADLLNDVGEFDFTLAKKRGKTHLIKKHKTTTFTARDGGVSVTVEVELVDTQRATRDLGDALGLFVKKIAPTDPTGEKPYEPLTDAERSARVAALLEQARARRAGQAATDGQNST